MSKTFCLLLMTLICFQSIFYHPVASRTLPLENYRRRMQKKDSDNEFEDMLFPSLLISELPERTPVLKKKAVDSTFIRFGRSPWSMDEDRFDSLFSSSTSTLPEKDPKNFEYMEMNPERHVQREKEDIFESESDQVKTRRPSSTPFPFKIPYNKYGCIIRDDNDLLQALMGKQCSKQVVGVKVKRENVNDTFIRFGKRAISKRMAKGDPSDLNSEEKQRRYNR